MRVEEVVVVGAGPAGCAAAIQCTRLGVRPLLLDRSGRAGGLVANAHCIENYPGLDAPMSGELFSARLERDLRRFELQVTPCLVRSVRQIDDRFEVSTSEGSIGALAVILASGTSARQLDLSGNDGGRVFYELRAMQESWAGADKLAVIGAGEAACDYALSLCDAGGDVKMLVRGSALRARGSLAERVRRARAVQIEYRARCLEAHAHPSGLQLVVDVKGERRLVEVEALLVAIGRKSTVSDLYDSHFTGKKEQKEAANARVEGLFVAGDARHGSLGQTGMAVGDGLRAAYRAVQHIESLKQCKS